MLHYGMRQKLFAGPKIRQIREGAGLNQLTFAERVVTAARRFIERRFGADKIRAGNEFTSVASGLALRARASQHALSA